LEIAKRFKANGPNPVAAHLNRTDAASLHSGARGPQPLGLRHDGPATRPARVHGGDASGGYTDSEYQ
jgi:hypothetical protein